MTGSACPARPLDYLTAVERWRLAWRPSEVKALIVAESHNAQLPGDDRVKVCVDPTIQIQRTLPRDYVRLVYCLGYGNDKVCEPRPPENNEGTPDYWEIFERIVTTGERHSSRPLPAQQTERQIAILERLAERGIWLEDASPIGLYLPGKGRLTDSLTDEAIVTEGWAGYVWPKFAANPPQHIWVIGRMVRSALKELDGVRGRGCIMQPGYARRRRIRTEYLAELDKMTQDLAIVAP